MGTQKRGPKPKDKAPTPAPGVPAMPPGLGKEAREHYVRLTSLMAESGLVSMLDFDSLSVYMSLWQRWRDAEKEVKARGMVIEAPNGWLQKNPWLEIAQQTQRDMRPFFNSFGLNPASRSKLHIGGEAETVDLKWRDFEESA